MLYKHNRLYYYKPKNGLSYTCFPLGFTSSRLEHGLKLPLEVERVNPTPASRRMMKWLDTLPEEILN